MFKKFVMPQMLIFAVGILLTSCSVSFLDDGKTLDETELLDETEDPEEEDPEIPSETLEESDLCRDWYGYVDGDGEETRELILRIKDDYSMTVYMRRHRAPEEGWTLVDEDEFLPVIEGSWSLEGDEITVRSNEIDLITIFLLSGNVGESWIEAIADPLQSENYSCLGLHDRNSCYAMMEYLKNEGYFSLNLISLSGFLDLFYIIESYDVVIFCDYLTYYHNGEVEDCFAPGFDLDSLGPCGNEAFRAPYVFPW